VTFNYSLVPNAVLNYAMIPAAGATAGATLIPMVMKAQITAANADRICVRAYCVMLISFYLFRTIPAMQTTLHGLCQIKFNVLN
jgi:hypothetical protein